MRKYSKRAQINRMRAVLSLAVRTRDGFKCCRCGKTKDEGKLDCSHIFPKGQYKSLQFELDNCVTHCFNCHRWWHENPVLATDWIIKYLGSEKFSLLKQTAKRSNALVNRIFLDRKEQELKELLIELQPRGESSSKVGGELSRLPAPRLNKKTKKVQCGIRKEIV